MPLYNNSSFGPSPVLLVGGRTEYLYGSFSDSVSPTEFRITSVADNGTVATVVGTIFSGNAPVVGALVSIQGTKTNAGAFNVTKVAIASVSANALTGVITITFPLVTTAVATTADSGFALLPVTVVYDTLANGSSFQAASAENDPSTNDERTYFAQVYFGTIPTACTVTLQGSLTDNDADYQNLGTVATVAAGAVTQSAATFNGYNIKFLRFNVSGLTGTGTIAAAVMG